MDKKELKIEIFEYAEISELREEIQDLVKKAIDASKNAYTPYSTFNVGAAILLDDGQVITGNNQENAAYPSGLCAERVAMFYANSQFPNKAAKAIAVIANNDKGITLEPVPPCGSCRQSLLESEQRFKKPIEVYLIGKDKIQMVKSISDLLPLTFGKEFL